MMTLSAIDSPTSSIPTPEEMQALIPFTKEHADFVSHSRKTLKAILNGQDKRRLIIAGPCSIHDLDSALVYADRLRTLANQVSDQFFVIMRTYFEKSRTVVGWKGLLYDPDLDGSYHLAKGVRLTRQLLADLTAMQIPVGCELLELNTTHYYHDFLTWGCIGARTSSSPPHRQLASALDFPIGFKNSTDGNIEYPIQGILAASAPHVYLGSSFSGSMTRVQTHGNPHCHLVLRGSTVASNYQPEAVQLAIQKCREAKVREKVLIDCSHGNCGKTPQLQKMAFHSVIQQIPNGNDQITGIMLESHLEEGTQDISEPLIFGMSITDPCIDWPTTEQLILQGHQQLQR